jgi:hypothetical protein
VLRMVSILILMYNKRPSPTNPPPSLHQPRNLLPRPSPPMPNRINPNYAFYRGFGADVGLSDPVFRRRCVADGIDPDVDVVPSTKESSPTTKPAHAKQNQSTSSTPQQHQHQDRYHPQHISSEISDPVFRRRCVADGIDPDVDVVAASTKWIDSVWHGHPPRIRGRTHSSTTQRRHVAIRAATYPS